MRTYMDTYSITYKCTQIKDTLYTYKLLRYVFVVYWPSMKFFILEISLANFSACINLESRILPVPYHYPTRDLQRKLSLMKQGVTIFTIT